MRRTCTKWHKRIGPNFTFCFLLSVLLFQETQDYIHFKMFLIYHNLKYNPHPPALYHSMSVHSVLIYCLGHQLTSSPVSLFTCVPLHLCPTSPVSHFTCVPLHLPPSPAAPWTQANSSSCLSFLSLLSDKHLFIHTAQ